MKKVIIFFILFLSFTKVLQAAETDLVISEVMYDWPGSDNNHEWVEVYNSGSEDIEIITGSGNSWRFFDGSNHVLNLQQGTTTIATGEFFVIADNTEEFLIDYPNFSGILFDTSMSLGNSGDDLALSANGGNNYFSQTNYHSDYGAHGTGFSLEKINLTQDDSQINWQESSVDGGTPGLPNSEPIEDPDILSPQAEVSCPTSLLVDEVGIFDGSNSTDPQDLPLTYFWDFLDGSTATSTIVEHSFTEANNYNISLTVDNGELNNTAYCLVEVIADDNSESEEEPGGGGGSTPPPLWSFIQVSEFLPNPAGSDSNEWIELYNGSSQTIDITGMKLQDNSARVVTLTEDDGLNYLINPDSFLVLPKAITGISLNNTGGDAVKLYNPDEELLEIIEYSDTAQEDKSFARQPRLASLGGSGNTFLWTALPTPGEPNEFLANQPPQAKISLQSEDLLVGEKIILSAENSTDPEEGDLEYAWDFGDETTGDEIKENHIYQSAGSYLIKLIVTDSEGATAEDTLLINIVDQEVDLQLTEIQPITFELNELMISEFIPNPVGSDDNEWIELYNNSNQEINLKGWQLDDQDGGSKPYTFAEDFILLPQEFKIIDRSVNKITLNNSEDSVRLLTPLTEVWQEVIYNKIPEGSSYAWDNSNQEWFVNNIPSPSEPNFFAETQPEILNVNEIYELEKNEVVYTQGIALHDIDKTKQSLYLANFDGLNVDYNNLLEVYCYQKDWPEIFAGDFIEVQGKISKTGELPRVKISNQSDLIVNQIDLELTWPENISPDDLDEDLLGDLVVVKGMVTKKSGKNIYLASDIEAEPMVRVYTNFSTKELEIKKEAEIVVAGILSETDSGYKLTPFKISDILVPQVLGMAVSGEASEDIDANLSDKVNQAGGENRKLPVKKALIWIIILGAVLGGAYFVKNKFS